MKSPLRQVFTTYTSRPLVWVLVCVAFILTGALWYQSLFGRPTSSWIAPGLSQPSPWAFVAEPGSAGFRGALPGEARTLSLSLQGPLPDLREFPNVCAVVLRRTDATISDLQQLTALPRLKSLQVNTINFPAGGLALLGEQLEELEIDASFLNAFEDELSALTHLRLLRTGGSALNARTLAAISQIPHLQQLVVGPVTAAMTHFGAESVSHDAYGRLDLPAAAFQPLTEHPHLCEVYANWSPRLEDNRPLMTAMQSYPLYTHTKQNIAVVLTFFLMFVWCFLLLLQLGAQFLSPAARLVPRFALPHQAAVVIILSVAAALGATGLMLAEINLLITLVIVLLVPAYFVLMTELCVAARTDRRAKLALGPLVLFFCIGPLSFLQVAHARYPWIQGLETWFLDGRYPLLAEIVLGLETIVVGLGVLRLPHLGRGQAETVPVPKTSAMAESFLKIPTVSRSASHRWMEGDFSRFHYQTDSTWRRVTLLRKGSDFRPILILTVYLAAFLLIQVVISQNLLRADSSKVIWSVKTFVLPLVQVPFVMFVMAMMVWFRRRSSLEMEFCRPHSRREFAWNLCWALAIDLSSALIPCLGLLVLMIGMQTAGAVTLGAIVLCVAAVWLGLYAAALACVVFKRRLPVYTVWATAFLLSIAGIGTIGGALASSHRFPGQDAWLLQFSLAVLSGGLPVLLLLIGLIYLLYRQCVEREWG